MINDEIKEILDKLKDGNWYNELDLTGTMWIELKWEETHLLLDYITNLQQKEKLFEKIVYKYDELKQENERLKLEKDTKSASEIICENLHDVYKSRCEKAVEYNQQVIKDTKDFYRPTEDRIYSGDTLISIAEQNINILNGRSDE